MEWTGGNVPVTPLMATETAFVTSHDSVAGSPARIVGGVTVKALTVGGVGGG